MKVIHHSNHFNNSKNGMSRLVRCSLLLLVLVSSMVVVQAGANNAHPQDKTKTNAAASPAASSGGTEDHAKAKKEHVKALFEHKKKNAKPGKITNVVHEVKEDGTRTITNTRQVKMEPVQVMTDDPSHHHHHHHHHQQQQQQQQQQMRRDLKGMNQQRERQQLDNKQKQGQASSSSSSKNSDKRHRSLLKDELFGLEHFPEDRHDILNTQFADINMRDPVQEKDIPKILNEARDEKTKKVNKVSLLDEGDDKVDRAVFKSVPATEMPDRKKNGGTTNAADEVQQFFDTFRIEGLSLEEDKSLFFEVGTTDPYLTCATFGDNGNVDLDVAFGQSPESWGYQFPTCNSYSDTSYELCTAFDYEFSGKAFVEVYANEDTEDFTVECYPGFYQPEVIRGATLGMPIYDINLAEGGEFVVFFEGAVSDATCYTLSNNHTMSNGTMSNVTMSNGTDSTGDIDLYVYLDPGSGFNLSCVSPSVHSNEFCYTQSSGTASVAVLLFATAASTNVTLYCDEGAPPGPPDIYSLFDGVPFTGLDLDTGDVALFAFEDSTDLVGFGKEFTCFSDADSGDTALYYYESFPGINPGGFGINPLFLSSIKDSSYQGHTFSLLPPGATPYIAVVAFTDVENLNLTCTLQDFMPPFAPVTINPDEYVNVGPQIIGGETLLYSLNYTLSPIEEVTCFLYGGSDGDADLIMVPIGTGIGSPCFSESPSSDETCAIQAIFGDENILIFVSVFFGWSDPLSLYCSVLEPTLDDGILEGPLLPIPSFSYWRLDVPLVAGDKVACYVDAVVENGFGSLSLWLGGVSSFFDGAVRMCGTFSSTPNDQCIAIITDSAIAAAPEPFLFASVFRFAQGLSLVCNVGDTTPLISMELGVPATGQTQAIAGQPLWYEVTTPLAVGVEIECTVSAPFGFPELSGQFGNIPYSEGGFAFNIACFGNGTQTCTFAASDDSTFYIELFSDEPFFDATLNCDYIASTDPLNPTGLVYGESVGPFSGTADTVFFFVYSFFGVTALPDEEFTCTTTADNGDVSLGIRAGDPLKAFDCVSNTAGTSNEECTVTAEYGVVNEIYVQVDVGTQGVTDLIVFCDVSLVPTEAPAPPPTPRPTLPFIPPPP